MDRVPQSQAGLEIEIWSPIKSVNHAAVVFYRARDCAYRLTGNRLPLSILNDAIIQPYTAFLEREKARREAERQARLAQYGRREEPAAGQVERYVQAAYDNLLTELAQTESGLGLRHQRLYGAALTVGGLESAPWLTAAARERLRPAADDLLAAADANGSTAVYGEDDALRTIEAGLARGRCCRCRSRFGMGNGRFSRWVTGYGRS
jgi:hypothetical protein